jgi:hypothetical protein
MVQSIDSERMSAAQGPSSTLEQLLGKISHLRRCIRANRDLSGEQKVQLLDLADRIEFLSLNFPS